MEPFLKKLAQDLGTNYENNLDEICIILPNKRAKVFIMQFLAENIKTPAWAPEVYSIEDFVCNISDLQLADPLTLITQLYEAYQFCEGAHTESFDEFLQWGFILLGDFDEIDLNLADADRIFNYLSDAKAISQWDPEKKKLTEFQKKYLHFYRSINNYYKKYAQIIEKSKQVHRGYAYKLAAELLADKEIEWKKVIFAGFNALTKSELAIIDILRKQGKVDLFWDIDEYYFKNTAQEAGKFFRNYKSKLGSLNWVEANFKNAKNIHIHGTAKSVNQAKLAGNILNEIYSDYENKTHQQTALVLADENLLMPVLNSIPDEVPSMNVTMGYPLRNSFFYDFFDRIFEMYENADRLEVVRPEQNGRFYYKDVVNIVEHQVFETLVSDSIMPEEMLQNIISSNRVFWNLDDLKRYALNGNQVLANFIELLFNDENKQLPTLLSNILELIAKLKESLIQGNIEKQALHLELEFLYSFYLLFNKLDDFVEKGKAELKKSTLRKLYKQVVRQTKVPFEGEPLEGLQIMGILETRTIDFENIILLSANEGILPFGKSQNSFIPFDIKREFELPVYSDKDAIYAYHFYRMLQKAENIHLIYNTESGLVGANEKSRFIAQLQYELPLYNPETEIKESIETLEIKEMKPISDIVIEKEGKVIDVLKTIADKGFSATTLISYINCSLKFYFEKIAGLKDAETLEETIEANTLGTVAHEVLREFYQPLKGRNIVPQDIEGFIKGIGKVTDQKFREYYRNGQLQYGKNLLIAKVVKKFIHRYLQQELELLKQGANLRIVGIEEEYNTEFNISDNNLKVKLKGTADRIDELDGNIRIIDYKTGKVEKKELKIVDWSRIVESKSLNKSFQLMFYAYLYFRNAGISDLKVHSGIVSFRNLSTGVMNLTNPDNIDLIGTDEIAIFEDVLQNLLFEIFDESNPFRKSENKDICSYCSFKSICNR